MDNGKTQQVTRLFGNATLQSNGMHIPLSAADRNPDFDLGTLQVLRVKRELPTQKSYSLFHASNANPSLCCIDA